MSRVRIIISLFLLVIPLFVEANTEKNEELLEAIQSSDLTYAASLLKSGAEVNGTDAQGWPVFIAAVDTGKTGNVQFFLSRGVNIEIQGPDQETALMHAVRLKKPDIAFLLIKKGANVLAKDRKGRTVLMHASTRGSEALIKTLLRKKANPSDIDYDRKKAVDFAMEGRNIKIIKLLGSLETKKEDFLTAVKTGNKTAVRKLLRDGINVNATDFEGKPALILAFERKNIPMFKLLVESGADINLPNSKGQTLFMFLVKNGDYQLAKYLLKKGASADFNHKYISGKTALLIAVEKDDREFISLLMKQNQDLDIQDVAGNTALMLATSKGMSTVVQDLLKAGADPDVKRKDGKYAEEIARANGYSYLAGLLQSHSGK